MTTCSTPMESTVSKVTVNPAWQQVYHHENEAVGLMAYSPRSSVRYYPESTENRCSGAWLHRQRHPATLTDCAFLPVQRGVYRSRSERSQDRPIQNTQSRTGYKQSGPDLSTPRLPYPPPLYSILPNALTIAGRLRCASPAD